MHGQQVLTIFFIFYSFVDLFLVFYVLMDSGVLREQCANVQQLICDKCHSFSCILNMQLANYRRVYLTQ